MKQSKKSKASKSTSASSKSANSSKSAKASQSSQGAKSAKSKLQSSSKSAQSKAGKSQSAKVVKAGAQKKAAAKKSASSSTSSKRDVSERQDIVRIILEDHKPIKKLIPILKDSERSFEERQEAFSEFAHLLVNHAKPEEQSLYVYMKDEDELAEEGFEGDVEHAIADQLLNEIKGTGNKDLWSARVKVLAELVEHHIEEEEEELLPEFKKHAALEDRIQLGEAFLRLKAEHMEMEERANMPEESQEMHIPNH